MIKDKGKRGEIEALRWLVEVSENRELKTDAERWAFIRECKLFVARHSPGGATLRVAGRRAPREIMADVNAAQERNKSGRLDPPPPEDRRDWTERLQGRIQEMLHNAIVGDKIELPWPVYRSLELNKVSGRYEEKFDYRRNNTLDNATIGCFADLIVRHYLLLKACEASAPRKPGRKPEDARVEGVRTCGTVFVAERITGAYCSDTCRNRVLTRSKREKEKRLKARKRA
jgi:hypothetical protein